MFRVGDEVVLIAGEDKRILKVDFAGWDTNLSVTGLGKYKDIRGYVWDKKLFRLATTEEIAAGHRIESSNNQAISCCTSSDISKNESQNGLSAKQDGQDMGDDSHIENHVSPLCKMGVK